MNKKSLSIFLVILVIVVFGVIIVRENIKKNKPNNPPTSLIEPTIEDVMARLATVETTHIDTSTWKEYLSPTLGIKFNYPPTLFVAERADSVVLYEDTPSNRAYVKDPNSSEGPTNIITISATPFADIFTSSGFINKEFDSSVALKWQETNLYGNKAVAYTGFILDYFDGIAFAKNKTLYNFTVSFWPDPKQTTRDDYYKILSTIEFLN